jgi:cell wall-associated NlpC family hydrolase
MLLARTTTRCRSRAALAISAALLAVGAGILSPSSATAAPSAPAATPSSSAQAQKMAEAVAQQLTGIDEQVAQAQLTVAALQKSAAAARVRAAAAKAALAGFEPQMRAIAVGGFVAKSQSRMAAFLTSKSATELVQEMATLDMIAAHTEKVISKAAAAQDAARQATATATRLAAKATAGLAQLRGQQAALQQKAAGYRADFARLTTAEQLAVTNAVAGPRLAAPSMGDLPLAPSSAAGIAVRTALAHVGDPYVWGATGPNGFDCSGLTSYAWAAAGVPLAHSSRAQSEAGHAVSRSQLLPGDIVYFYSPVSHVGLYIGHGMMVHARTFGQGVAVASVDMAGYRGARRVWG